MTKLTLVRFVLGAVLVVLALSSVSQAVVCPPPPPCGCGLTPGYWKTHTDAWVGYSTGTSLQSVFGSNALSGSLLDALSFQGGPGTDGAKQILLRAAVASLLNSTGTTTKTTFALSTATVIADVTAALASGSRDTMLAWATLLDADNQDCLTTIG